MIYVFSSNMFWVTHWNVFFIHSMSSSMWLLSAYSINRLMISVSSPSRGSIQSQSDLNQQETDQHFAWGKPNTSSWVWWWKLHEGLFNVETKNEHGPYKSEMWKYQSAYKCKMLIKDLDLFWSCWSRPHKHSSFPLYELMNS